jgi:hypothetical protein
MSGDLGDFGDLDFLCPAGNSAPAPVYTKLGLGLRPGKKEMITKHTIIHDNIKSFLAYFSSLY